MAPRQDGHDLSMKDEAVKKPGIGTKLRVKMNNPVNKSCYKRLAPAKKHVFCSDGMVAGMGCKTLACVLGVRALRSLTYNGPAIKGGCVTWRSYPATDPGKWLNISKKHDKQLTFSTYDKSIVSGTIQKFHKLKFVNDLNFRDYANTSYKKNRFHR